MNKWTFATIATVLAGLAALVVWLRYEFSPTVAAVGLLSLFGVAVLSIGYLLALASQRATLNAIGDFQRQDDRGEIERMKALRMALGYDAKYGPKVVTNEWGVVQEAPQLPPPQQWPQLTRRQDVDDGVFRD